MAAPAWLDKQLLSSVLQQEHDEEVEVSSFTVKSAVPPGNNYLSDLLRVKVEFTVNDSTPKTTSLIVKAPIVKESQKDVPEEMDIYAKEPIVYKKLLPRLYEKLKIDIGPKCHPCQTEIRNLLILEDLKDAGFEMRDRCEQLDFEHCKAVLLKIAKFHAASVACMSEYSDLKVFNQEKMLDEKDPIVERLRLGVVHSARRVAELTKDMKECKGFSEYVLNNIENLWGVFEEMYNPPSMEGRFRVLVHGDFWTANIMFKYKEEGKIEDVKFVDFQLTRYVSPIDDVVFFLWTSGNIEECENRHEELYSLYLEELNKTFQELGRKERYSPEEFLKDRKTGIYRVLALICQHIPVLLADPEDGAFSVEDLNPDTESGRKNLTTIYEGKYYRRKLPLLAKQYLAWVSSMETV